MAENVIVGRDAFYKEKIREFIIRKYCAPGIKSYETMKEVFHPPEPYIDAIETLTRAFEEATLEQRVDVLVELIGFVISGRKAHLEDEIGAYGDKGSLSFNGSKNLTALLCLMEHTHDVGSKESLGNLLKAITQ